MSQRTFGNSFRARPTQSLVALAAMCFWQSSTAVTTYAGLDFAANEFVARTQSNAASSAFDSATIPSGGLVRVDFESAALGQFTSLAPSPQMTITGSFPSGGAGARSEIRNQSLEPGNARRGYNTTVGGANFNQVYGGSQFFDFSTPIVGFGLYVSGMQNNATLSFNDGVERTISFSTLIPTGSNFNGGVWFVGFTSSGTPFSRVTISFLPVLGEPDSLGIDDIRYITAVPEVGSSALCSAGLLLLLATRRFGRRVSGTSRPL